MHKFTDHRRIPRLRRRSRDRRGRCRRPRRFRVIMHSRRKDLASGLWSCCARRPFCRWSVAADSPPQRGREPAEPRSGRGGRSLRICEDRATSLSRDRRLGGGSGPHRTRAGGCVVMLPHGAWFDAGDENPWRGGSNSFTPARKGPQGTRRQGHPRRRHAVVPAGCEDRRRQSQRRR